MNLFSFKFVKRFTACVFSFLVIAISGGVFALSLIANSPRYTIAASPSASAIVLTEEQLERREERQERMQERRERMQERRERMQERMQERRERLEAGQ